jgi:hypothetical protein
MKIEPDYTKDTEAAEKHKKHTDDLSNLDHMSRFIRLVNTIHIILLAFIYVFIGVACGDVMVESSFDLVKTIEPAVVAFFVFDRL